MKKKKLITVMLTLSSFMVYSQLEIEGTGVLNSNAASDFVEDYRPQITTDGAGNWIAVWYSFHEDGEAVMGNLDILVSRSTDNAETWTAPVPLNTTAATDSGFDYAPQVTTDGLGHWIAVWYSFDDLGGTIGEDRDVLVARSTDNGLTWTDPVPLNSNAATDSGDEWCPEVTTDEMGHWVAVWYSTDSLGGTIGEDRDILMARSTDNGVTWTDPAVLNTNAATDSGNDYAPQVTTDGLGNWVAVWYSYEDLGGTIGTEQDILIARSVDHGTTWTDPVPLNTNATSDTGLDSFPELVTDGAGHWIAVWFSHDSLGGTIGEDRDILMARSTDNALTWSDPEPLNTNAYTDSGLDGYPQLTTDRQGRWVAIWGSSENLGGTIGTDYDILMAQSMDDGLTWTDPAPISMDAHSDSGRDDLPQLTTDLAGNWVAVWQSDEDLGGTIGTDCDILYGVANDMIIQASDRLVNHVTSNVGGFSTRVFVSNSGGTAAQVSFQPRQLDGQLLGPVSAQIESGSFIEVGASDLFDGADVSHFSITAPQECDVTVGYRIAQGQGATAHVNESDQTGFSFLVYPGEQEIVFDGLALVNTGTVVSEVLISFLDRTGDELTRETLAADLAPNAKVLHTLDAYDLDGVAAILITSTQPSSALFLRGTRPGIEPGYLFQVVPIILR